MLHIPPIREIFLDRDLPTVQLQRSSTHDLYSSSLCSAGEGGVFTSIVSIMTWPFRFTGRVLVGIKNIFFRYVLCGWFCSGDEKMDWARSKVIFGGIHTAVCTSKNHLKQRMNMFKTHLEELSNPALERFKEHIGFALAKKEWIRDRAKQEEWYLTKKEKIDFEQIFNNIESNTVLREAVESFHSELQRKA